jgi:hypothetical protein
MLAHARALTLVRYLAMRSEAQLASLLDERLGSQTVKRLALLWALRTVSNVNKSIVRTSIVSEHTSKNQIRSKFRMKESESRMCTRTCEGDMVGTFDGLAVGAVDGATVGRAVGAPDGT